MFRLQLQDYPDLKKIDLPEGRRYFLPNNANFPSVTTILSAVAEPKPHLEAWKERVGEEASERKGNQAKIRGTLLHNYLENYIRHLDIPLDPMPSNYILFKQFRNRLDRHLDIVYGIEAPLYSTWLHAAGTADLIGTWDKIPSIIDYKTAGWDKEKDDIEEYFLQTALYAMMYNDGGWKPHCEQLVVLIGTDSGNDQAQMFIEPLSAWESKARNIVDKYTKATLDNSFKLE